MLSRVSEVDRWPSGYGAVLRDEPCTLLHVLVRSTSNHKTWDRLHSYHTEIHQDTRTNFHINISRYVRLINPYALRRSGFGPVPLGASFSLTSSHRIFLMLFSSRSSFRLSFSILPISLS